MIEFGFEPFPDPAPWHANEVHVEVQLEQYVMPLTDYMLIRRPSGKGRVILTGGLDELEPYMVAIKALLEE